jgi:hypothetical protein
MTEREKLQRQIASILDHPFVFMGGPSQQNMHKAERIIQHLAKSKMLLTALADEEDHSR